MHTQHREKKKKSLSKKQIYLYNPEATKLLPPYIKISEENITNLLQKEWECCLMIFSLFSVISMHCYPLLLWALIYTSGGMCICMWGQIHKIWYRSSGDVNCHGCTDVSKDALISSSRWFAFLYVKSIETRCCFNLALRHFCRQMLMQIHSLFYVQIYILPCSTHCKQGQEL